MPSGPWFGSGRGGGGSASVEQVFAGYQGEATSVFELANTAQIELATAYTEETGTEPGADDVVYFHSADARSREGAVLYNRVSSWDASAGTYGTITPDAGNWQEEDTDNLPGPIANGTKILVSPLAGVSHFKRTIPGLSTYKKLWFSGIAQYWGYWGIASPRGWSRFNSTWVPGYSDAFTMSSRSAWWRNWNRDDDEYIMGGVGYNTLCEYNLVFKPADETLDWKANGSPQANHLPAISYLSITGIR